MDYPMKGGLGRGPSIPFLHGHPDCLYPVLGHDLLYKTGQAVPSKERNSPETPSDH